MHSKIEERERNRWLLSREKAVFQLSPHGEIKVVLAYPNRYWIGMSNLGFQTIYKLLAENPLVGVERAFVPEDEGQECRTFESGASLSESDILAFSVSFETDYPNILGLLEAGGIRLEDRFSGIERPGSRPLILGGGAALTLNPEPLADFFDAIVIGEGEEVISEIINEYQKAIKEKLELDLLLMNLSKLEGVYVPRLYKPVYKGNEERSEIAGFNVFPGANPRTKRRILKDLDKYASTTVIQTPETEFKSMFMTETGRGCQIGCKFCVAGYMYRPVRKRSEKTIADSLKLELDRNASVGFVGAAVSSHPRIAELAESVAKSGGRAALSSIMTQRVTPKLAKSLNESEYKTVALAPECGTEELRFRIGKRVLNDTIIEAVARLAGNGIRNFKLYFIIGLPFEKLEDVIAIPELVKQAQQSALEAARGQEDFSIAPKIILSVNPFIPKAWTPFQRHPSMSFKELKSRLELVRRGVRKIPNVLMKSESPRESYFQALLSRGDRKTALLLHYLHKNGKDWRWLVKNRSKVIVNGVCKPDEYVYRTFGEKEILPWEIVDLKIKRSLLERQYMDTFCQDISDVLHRARVERAS